MYCIGKRCQYVAGNELTQGENRIMVECKEKEMLKVLKNMVKKYSDDTRFHTQHEWDVERGETIGSGAICTITSEGELYQLLNAYQTPTKTDMYFDKGKRGIDKFNDLCAKYGFWFEPGFAWSYHFYPIDK